LVRLPDVTQEVPARRMSVARGRLEGLSVEPDAAQLAMARIAALHAVKNAASFVPAMVPFQPTDAFSDISWAGGAVETTVTVQGFARTLLSSAALAGASAVLLSLLESAGHPAGARISALEIVQNVKD
jgi:molybdenum cofactor biosynthesis enzyme